MFILKKRIIFIFLITIFIIFVIVFVKKMYKNYLIDHAVKKVILEKEEIDVFDDVYLKDIIKSINGKIIDDFKIDTTKVGLKEINFKYKNSQDIVIPYTIYINIVDRVAPIISQPKVYSVIKNSISNDELEKKFFCGDNYDDNPICTLTGNYDLSEVGDYEVTLTGKDSSSNVSQSTFVLRVVENNKSQSPSNNSFTDFNDIVKKYKNEKTKIGIDVSHWQGNINFSKLKNSGVEFAYIRVGRGDGIGKSYVLDEKFYRNIEGFNKVGIPVGVYFYSYANSREDAKKEAKWVISKLKKYNVELEIVFDWENWGSFSEFDLSFYHLTDAAMAFVDTVSKYGYRGMVYSSKNYLENIWFPLDSDVWLAHYTDNTDYTGKYKVWQICNNGKVNGIKDNLVDIDIMYK